MALFTICRTACFDGPADDLGFGRDAAIRSDAAAFVLALTRSTMA